MPRRSEIEALVSLLGDEDPKITELVWEHLAALGAEVFPALRAACENPEPRLRLRARHVLDLLIFEQIEADLREACETEGRRFDLERALWALARVEDPELPRGRVGLLLDQLVATIRPRLAGCTRAADRLATINTVLFEEMNFVAVQRSLADTRSFCLRSVVERRSGAPVMLAALYLLIGGRLRIPLLGVSFPSHLLVRLGSGAGEIFIDPARGGKLLTRRECMQTYLRDYYPKDSYLHEATGRDITVRAVRGLMLLYARNQDRLRARRLGRFLEILQARERTR